MVRGCTILFVRFFGEEMLWSLSFRLFILLFFLGVWFEHTGLMVVDFDILGACCSLWSLLINFSTSELFEEIGASLQ